MAAVMARLSVRHFSGMRGPALSANVNANIANNVAKYPPMLPSRTAKSRSAKRRRVAEFFEELKGYDVKDKLASHTKFQRMKYVVYPQTFALNADKWYQHFTKTAYISGLPDKFSSASHESAGESPKQTTFPQVDDATLEEIRTLISDSLLQEHCQKVVKRRPFLYKQLQQSMGPFLTNVTSGLACILAEQSTLLQSSTFDCDPEVNFYWIRGKRIIPCGHRVGRPEPLRFQIEDRPNSQLRIPQQLPEFVPLGSEISVEVPVIQHLPDKLPLFRRQYENSIHIGAKVDDPCCYGHTQFHLVSDRLRKDDANKRIAGDYVGVALRANAISSLFAWTGAQAMYQGFWSVEDVDRPFTSQAVITDGQHFSFFCYQLNTLALTNETDADNPRKNLCWGVDRLKLYEDISNNKVIGLNDDVIRLLVQFLLNGA